ncbi:MAG: AAA family ATPase, partial [Candidatus Dormibacteraceae bacterium]
MYLRSITLTGFKTFALRTEIRFEGGVTAIVGPNGSGKTNIVDAFKWVLGETQARDLRGRRMEDVVYSGGSRRPRAAHAEVALVIDNSDGGLPIDYEEVAIGRRVDRGGQSDYFLNGARVRRRDVLDLLRSTGLTVDSYALIDQSDIEGIVTCSPEERRLLIEGAAQVRGIKARRAEAAARLRELSQNLARLADVRREIEPRVETMRLQAGVAREAAAVRSRLDVLRGSLLWEQWREARDAHRRAMSQAGSLSRRLGEAGAASSAAEAGFQAARQEAEAAQDRRLLRQRLLGGLRLDLSRAEHELAMARQRAAGQADLARAAIAEDRDLAARAEAAATLARRLEEDHAQAAAELEAIPAEPAPPAVPHLSAAGEARREADGARRAVAASASALAGARTRRQFLEESVGRLERHLAVALAALPAAETRATAAVEAARVASEQAAELVRIRAELEGLEALGPAGEHGLRRLGDVIVAEPGWEAALSAVLGPLIDAGVAAGLGDALRLADPGGGQRTMLFPEPA